MAGLDLRGPLALDANCLSYMILGLDSARKRKMNSAGAEARPLGLQASALALAEVLVEPAQNGPHRRLEQAFASAIHAPNLTVMPLDAETAKLAAEIRAAARLKLPDAVVIASAVVTGADLLLSNDRQVVRVAQEYLRAVYFDDWDPEAPEPS